MRAAVAQFNAGTDKEANRATVLGLIQQAAEQGASLVVLPEYSMHSNPDQKADLRPHAESIDGDFASAVGASAKQHGVHVVVGMTEAPTDAGEERVINTVLAFGDDGARVGVYRKVHLYDAFGHRESDRVAPQSPEALTFKLGDLTFGVMTCYDLRFPEMARFLVDAGANALIVPAAWAVGPAKEDHWQTLARARAIENTSYVLASGQTGPTCTGQSVIVDPMGTVAASAGEEPGVATAQVDGARVESVRAKNPSLSNRRFRVRADS